jgi:hypothetical protein
MDSQVKSAVEDSIDRALSSFGYVDKETFYQTLEAQCKLKKEDIAENYEVFHTFLRRTFGLRHHAIERKIIEKLHNLSKNGTYSEMHEIPAFTLMVESYFKEADEAIERSKVKIAENKARLDEMKKKTG